MASPRSALLPFLLVAAAVGASAQDTSTEAFPRVGPLSGDVRVWHGKAKRVDKLSEPMAVSPQDRLGCGDANVASFLIEPGVSVSLKGVEARAEEGLCVLVAEKRLALRLYRGRVVVDSLNTDVAVETEQGKAVGRAIFLVEATKGAARIVSLEGTLKVTSDLGPLDLRAGDAAMLKKGRLPFRVPAGPADVEAGWAFEAEAPLNLLKNGGFEHGLTDWMALTYKRQPVAHSDFKAARSGKRSLRIELSNTVIEDMNFDSPDNDQQNCIVYQKYPQKAPRYLLRLWLKTEGLTVGGKEGRLLITCAGESLECPRAEGEWRCARFIVKEGYACLRLAVAPPDGGKSKVSGRVWIDDAFLAPLPEPPPAPERKER